jgi:hypothetical protein
MLQLLLRGLLFYWMFNQAILSYFDLLYATITSNKPQERISARKKINKVHHNREDKRHMAWKENVWTVPCSLDEKMVDKEQS